MRKYCLIFLSFFAAAMAAVPRLCAQSALEPLFPDNLAMESHQRPHQDQE